MTTGGAVVRLEAVTKVYQRDVRALDGVSLAIPRQSFTAVMGPSGSGKSTLLRCAAGLETPTSGAVYLGNTRVDGMSETRLTKLRRTRVGFVFQSFNLVSSLTVRQNVELPLRLAGKAVDRPRVDEVLHRVGLAERARHRPAELSGGQQQRVAIARALITGPDVIVGDEPTGALDTMTAQSVLAMLRGCVDQGRQTVVVVTHDPVVAAHADRVLFLADGRLAGELDSPRADVVAQWLTRLGGRTA